MDKPIEYNVVVKHVLEYNDDFREEISRLFVDGFFQWFQFFSRDKEKLTLAFAHIFQLEHFYAATVNNQLAGITACTDGKESSVRLDKKELKKHLGWYKGLIAGIMLKRELEEHPYPFAIAPNVGSVEFVSVSYAFQRQGVASALIRYIHERESYDEFVLEVADTNEKAVGLYEKLGYKEIKRVKEPNTKYSGINFLIYMRYKK